MIGLGDLPGGFFASTGYGVSDDGRRVVGRGRTASVYEAFIWDETNGMRRLLDVLVNDYGLDLTGWVLTEATEISGDGRTITGTGTHNGNTEAWMAQIPALPCDGDVNGDGTVDLIDLNTVLFNFGQSCP